MDFARKQLEKYGWTDGKGLGKHENGISEALKPKLKRSVAGIGHDAAADFTEHWWTQLYNKAAGNVEVEEKNGKTKKIKTKEDKFEITNSTWKIKRKKNSDDQDDEYKDFFVRKAVLTGSGSKTENVSVTESEDETDESKDVFKMTDEELFAACEGRTAHKGARHGLKATGKLARIAQQEQMLLSQPQYKEYSHAKKAKSSDKSSGTQDSEENSASNKKQKKKRKNSSDENSEVAESGILRLEYNEKNKEENVASVDNVELTSRKSKKSKSSNQTFVEEDSIIDEVKIKKKAKAANPTKEVESLQVTDVTEETEVPIKKKKKKKNKYFPN